VRTTEPAIAIQNTTASGATEVREHSISSRFDDLTAARSSIDLEVSASPDRVSED
jgi:hypothetical protein